MLTAKVRCRRRKSPKPIPNVSMTASAMGLPSGAHHRGGSACGSQTPSSSTVTPPGSLRIQSLPVLRFALAAERTARPGYPGLGLKNGAATADENHDPERTPSIAVGSSTSDGHSRINVIEPFIVRAAANAAA